MNNLPGIKLGLQGKYRCVLNEGTEREVDTGWFDNLITNGGLDYLADFSIGSTVQYGSIGTGTATPANGNTSLQAWVASASTNVFDSDVNAGTPTWVVTSLMHWVYAQGAVVGNMAEVGVGWATGGVNLFSRALILDGGGSPTTLTVTSLDQLTVYYQITVTPQLTDITGTVTLDSISYNYTGRISLADSWNNNFQYTLSGANGKFGAGKGAGGFGMTSYSTQTLGAVDSTPTGSGSNGADDSTGITVGSYTAGQKYLDSIFTCGPTECNSAGGVGSICFFWAGSQMQYQYSFAATSGGAVIPKDNTKTMSFTIRLSWDRV